MEADPGDLSRLFRLAPDAEDAGALMRLQSSIETRRAAREDAELKRQLAGLREAKARNFGLAHFVAQARENKLQIATVPRVGRVRA